MKMLPVISESIQQKSTRHGWVLVVVILCFQGSSTSTTMADAFSNCPGSTHRRTWNRIVQDSWSGSTPWYPLRDDSSIHNVFRVRGGESTTTSLAAAARKAASSSALKHPIVQTLLAWIIAFWKTVRQELQSLNGNQRWIVLAVFLVGLQLGRSLSSWSFQRFKDAVDIPTKYFGPTAPLLVGRAVSVSDGDTLRFYHTPTPFHKSKLDKKKKLAENTLPIRVCTIDTPETSKFGKPGQPYGEEAKQELQRLVENRMIHVRLLSKDQYGRAVGQVFAPRTILGRRRGVDEILLRAGLAEVYQGMGAVYGPKGKAEYLKLEGQARQAKKGIWSLSKRESAAEYKRRAK